MPSRVWPLWSLTGLLLLGFPALNVVYWPQILRSGALPPDGDTIAIPVFGSIIVAFVAFPFVLGVASLCLRAYNPDTRLAAWRADRPLRSAVATAIFVPPAALIAAEALEPLLFDLPWYEVLWSAYGGLCTLWLLALRAAAVEQLQNS